MLSRGELVVLIGGCVARGGGSVSQRLIKVLATKAEAVRRDLVLAGLGVGLGSAMGLNLAWDTVDGEVLVHEMEETGLDLFEHIVALLADEAVIVFASDVDDELLVVGFGTLGESHHLLKAD